MSDSPLPWAWPAPELGEPAWPGPPPAYDPAAGAAYAPAAADPDAANGLPTPRRGSRRHSYLFFFESRCPAPVRAPGRRGPPGVVRDPSTVSFETSSGRRILGFILIM
ncbi:hypothetical protein SSAG_04465 [Streptomyces sp. Mg1]|nr:hypothetical protein SSAG_04465 [Streptomyces sp. Mg1]